MKKLIQQIFLSTASLILMVGCFKDPIDLNLNDNNEKLAIEAWINTLDEDQFVILRKTANYLGNDPYIFETGANITLTDQQGNEYKFEEQEEGKYLLDPNWEPNYESEYTLTIETKTESYSAKHNLRESPEIENLFFEPYFNEEDSLLGFETVFAFQETPGEGDAYYVVDYLKGTTVGDTILNGSYADDIFYDGEYISDIRITEEDRLFEEGDTVIVEIFSIGKPSAQFLQDIELEVFRGGPFDPPPANVRTNFTGDVVGYFIMSGSDQQEIIIQ